MPAGRPKNIETPEVMHELWEGFKANIKSNPILIIQHVGKDGREVHVPHTRPLTLEGFSVWLWKNGITTNVHDYFGNARGAYEEFSYICRVIKEEIRADQIEGGMVGIYNPSITQRLNGLTDKKEVDVKGGLNIPPLPDIGNRK